MRVRPKHGKGRVVIAGLVNNDFEPLKKLTDQPLEHDGSTGRESGRGWPISEGGRGVTSGIRARLAISVLTREAS